MLHLTSKFFHGADKRINKLDDFEIPLDWWSRPHEYSWSSEFLNKDDIILDAGCGVIHPFKFYASKRVKKVYAVDLDPEIKNIEVTDNLEAINADITNLETIKSNSINKVFCISVLEHLYPQGIKDALSEFKRVVKNEGYIILTLDYPHLQPETLINIINEIGLQFVADVDFSIDKHKVIKGTYGNLKCYRALLTKNEPSETKKETKVIEPKETKPLKPKSKKK